MFILAQAISDEDIDVRAGVLQLVNSILNGLDDIGSRAAFRRELESQKFMERYYHGMETYSNSNQSYYKSTRADDKDKEHHMHENASTKHSRRPTVSLRYERTEAGTLELQHRNMTIPALEMAASELVSTSLLLASDGKTVIDPTQGIMAGTLLAAKHLSQGGHMITDVLGGKKTKQRWYQLDKNKLQWYLDKDSTSEVALGSIEVSSIILIRRFSNDKYLGAECNYCFEIETEERVYSFGTNEDGEKDAWITAFQVFF